MNFTKCYIIRHAERFDLKYPFDWLIKCLTSINIFDFCDTPITYKGFIDAYKLGYEILFVDNFVPDVIYCSPSLRCKQTAIAIAFVYKKIGYDIKIIIDNNLRDIEYIEIYDGNFNTRIENIFKNQINSGKYKNLILITHANVVKDLSYIFEKKCQSYSYIEKICQVIGMNYLSTCVLDGEGNIECFF